MHEKEREMDEIEKNFAKKQQENKELEDKLVKLLPLINEANLCAEKFHKDVIFETYLMNKIPESHKKLNIERMTETMIKVINHEHGEQYLWDIEKFTDRLYMIRELLNQYFETDIIPKM